MDNDEILADGAHSWKQSGIEALEATFELCSEENKNLDSLPSAWIHFMN